MILFQALDFIKENHRDFGIARCRRLSVSGAFHTQLMASAKKEYLSLLREIDISKPVIPVFANVTSHRFHNPDQMRKLLVDQLCCPVNWEQTMHVLYSRPQGEEFPATYELGPGEQLGAMLKKTNLLAFKAYQSVKV